MKKIDGTPKTLRELFTGVKYTIHYYQREYQWQRKQVEELLYDLTEEFNEFYNDTDERSKVESYGHYFMGSIVLTADENAIIDGQQRLTSLTLLLIYLYHNLEDDEERAEVMNLIFSKKSGTKTFNIHVPEMPERALVMNALLKDDKTFDLTRQPETVRNIHNRYADIVQLMNGNISPAALPIFKDWLIDNVDFIRIVAQTEQDAHKIFVSMNDRGLSLTPAEMLKGFLLSKIDNDDVREHANDLWKRRVLELKELGKEEESDFIKNWLRAQYAETIRERKKNATPGDFDDLGSGFHKWVREHTQEMKLQRSADYEEFVIKTFDKFCQINLDLKRYAAKLTPGYEYVFFNADQNFTLQFQLILASIDPKESKEISTQKIRLVSCFLDLYFTRRIFNYKQVDYSSMQYNLFLITKKIRRLSVNDLLNVLKDELLNLEFKLDAAGNFELQGWSVRFMHHLLARLTDYVETQSGSPSRFETYASYDPNVPYDIEHILPDDYEQVKDVFSSEEEFYTLRQRFGSLLLLPYDRNRSLQDKPYIDKLPVYLSENLLARSLHPDGYQNAPRFKRFIEEANLEFKPFSTFSKELLMQRQQLYKALANKVWGVERLEEQLN